MLCQAVAVPGALNVEDCDDFVDCSMRSILFLKVGREDISCLVVRLELDLRIFLCCVWVLVMELFLQERCNISMWVTGINAPT